MRAAKRRLARTCLVCSAKIKLALYGKDYIGGHYFGKFKLPLKPGGYKKVGTTRIGRTKIDVVKWTGKQRELEYWECNRCFDEASHETWLEAKLEKLFGRKCKDYEPRCAVCAAWFLFETIRDDNRGKL